MSEQGQGLPAAKRADGEERWGENLKPPIQLQLAFWLCLLIVILAAVALRARFLNSFPLTFDEGIHLTWLRLLSAGYRPYEQVYITYPPFYPLALEAVWRIWPTEVAERWFSVAYAVFGVVGIALVARKFAGSMAGVAAAVLLLFSPTLFEFSRAIMAEFPSVAWSVWAIWLAWLYRDGGRRVLLVLSGLCLALSLLTKVLSPFLVALIPIIVLARWVSISTSRLPSTWQGQSRSSAGTRFEVKLGRYALYVTDYKPLLVDLLIWGAVFLLTVGIFVVTFDVKALLAGVVNQRLAAYAAYADENSWQSHYNQVVSFLQGDMALPILAFLGLGVAWVRRQRNLWLMLVWLILALIMLLIHTPLSSKHFLILLPHLTIFGGLAISYWASNVILWLNCRKNRVQAEAAVDKSMPLLARPSSIAVSGLILLTALSLWQIPATLDLWQSKADVPQPPPDDAEALAFVDQVTAPNDCMITDDVQLLYWSGRMTPPELAEVSANRLKSDSLTLEELTDISDRYDCQLVAAVTHRISRALPDYMTWVKHKYLGHYRYSGNDIYFAKLDTTPKPATPLKANFAGQITLYGYTLSPAPVTSGARLPLTLVWQAQTRLNADYAIFVQLRDAKNATLASADHQPYKGLAPTSRWPEGAIIQETTWLNLPASIPPGQYNIYLGLYNPANLERLPLVNDSSGENALILGPVSVIGNGSDESR
jgi:hypothetical protein